MTYDLAIIGAGSAAFAAAIHARRKGRRVVMVERDTVGGTCVNVGCIPSKALLAAAEARRVSAERRFPGIDAEAGPVRMAELTAGKDQIVTDLRRNKYLDLAREYDWEIIQGSARFEPGPSLNIDGHRVEARHYLVATGSTAWIPPIEGLAEVEYLTSTSAMELTDLPESLVVIGGNYIGLELGQLFARLGSRVALVEALERIAPREEPEISTMLESVLQEEGITVHTGATVTGVRRANGRVSVSLGGEHQRQLEAMHILVAAGRRAQTAGLGLEEVGVALGPKGEVVVDEYLRTSSDRIWAAGDVTGHPQFVYVAGAHGVAVVENALGDAKATVDYRTLPRVTFTSPNIAAVGLTEREARESGIECECRSVPLDLVPRALVNRDTRGLVKIVAEAKSGAVRGIHMLAPNAGDAILAGVYAIECGMTVPRLANIWCPYLTISEGIKLAAQAFTMEVTKLSCCGA